MIKLEWLGQSRPKVVELPIPFLSRSEKTGEVRCDPIGEFPDEAAQQLLGMAPDFWRKIDEQTEPQETTHPSKRPSNLTIWRERQRALKVQQSAPSPAVPEGAFRPSQPDQVEGHMEVV